MLKKGKHTIKEFNGTICTVVESGLSIERMEFLKELLLLNKYDVMIEENVVEGSSTFTLGVTDLVFNPMIDVYQLTLKRKDGTPVSIAYWNQQLEEMDLPYFEYREKNADSPNEDDFLSNPWAFRTIG